MYGPLKARLTLSICAALSSVASQAAAHGPPAAVTGIAARDDAGPRVVSLTEGFGIRLQSGWRWICPAEFGEELSPPATSADGGTTFVVGQDDLFALDADGGISPQHRPDLSRRSVVSCAALGGRIFALRLVDAGASDIVAFDGADAVWHDQLPYASMTPDNDTLWVARIDGAVGYATHLATDGTVIETRTFTVDPGDQVVQVRRVAGVLYATVVTAAAGGKLLLLGEGDGGTQLVLASGAPVGGPVPAGAGSAWAVADGTLQSIAGGTAIPRAIADPVSCVGSFDGAAFLCSQTRLLALDASGAGNELFSLSSLRGRRPPDELTDPVTCGYQWVIFRGDLTRAGVTIPLDAGADASSTRGVSGGCTISRVAGGEPLALMPAVAVFLAMLCRGRGRRLRYERYHASGRRAAAR
jgi:hypothetical protein